MCTYCREHTKRQGPTREISGLLARPSQDEINAKKSKRPRARFRRFRARLEAAQFTASELYQAARAAALSSP